MAKHFWQEAEFKEVFNLLNPSQRMLLNCGFIIVSCTWLYLALVRPRNWDSFDAPGGASLSFVGYATGLLIIFLAIVSQLPKRVYLLFPLCTMLNIMLGTICSHNNLPLYLDTVGSCFIGVLCGPFAGFTAGGLSSLIRSLYAPVNLPFVFVGAAAGGLAGIARHFGLFNKFYTALLSGFVSGILCGVLSAPIAAFVYQTPSTIGTSTIIEVVQSMGHSLVTSITTDSILTDPFDKAIVFFLVWILYIKLEPEVKELYLPKRKVYSLYLPPTDIEKLSASPDPEETGKNNKRKAKRAPDQ